MQMLRGGGRKIGAIGTRGAISGSDVDHPHAEGGHALVLTWPRLAM